MAKVISQPALGQDDIKTLKDKIKATHEEVEEITNRRNVNLLERISFNVQTVDIYVGIGLLLA